VPPDLDADLAALEPEMIARRRDVHQHPELGFKETRTAGVVADELRRLGLPVRTGVGRTGVVADLVGARPGPCILLRFDMDALPVQEATGAPYASVNAGVSHACGHDAHVAIGLALAKAFATRKAQIAGRIRFVFQPAEEIADGAKGMIADGALADPAPVASFGLHVWNKRPVGWIGATPGPCMAAVDRFEIELEGGGGHGALPHLANDAIVASAHVVAALQTVVARNVDPLEAAILSVGMIQGGDAFNVLPDRVRLRGTLRSYVPSTRDRVVARLTEVATGVAAALGCRAQVRVEALGIALANDEAAAARVREIARQTPGVTDVTATERTMGGEDMAYFLERAPGCFFFVGSANPEKGLDASHHTPAFDIDERALLVGARVLARVAADHVLR